MKIWHYTDFTSALKIIETQSILLSRITDSNDGTDCIWIQSILEEHFVPILYNSLTNKQKRCLIGNSTNPQAIIREDVKVRIQALFSTMAKQDGNAPFESFITCFSKPCGRNGEHGKLSMWRGYGREEPVALVFDGEKLSRLATHVFAGEDQPMMMFRDVAYAADTEELKLTMAKHLDTITPAFETEILNYEGVDNYELMLSAGTLAFSTKHPGFFEEDEVRLAIVMPDPHHENYDAMLSLMNSKNQVETINHKRRFRWSLGAQFWDCLDMIVLGPRMQPKESELKKYIKTKGKGVPIKVSAIPFR